MRRLLFLTAATVGLSACAATPPRPVEVSLSQTLLEVRLSNGQTCTGPAPAAAAAGWSGTLEGCAVALPYEVTIDPGTNPVRFVLQEIFTAIGLTDAIAPIATVTITDATGRTRTFASPPPREGD